MKFSWDTYRSLDVQPTGQLIKAGEGQIGGWVLNNGAAAIRFLKIYDKATAPTQADTPKLTIEIPIASASIMSPGGSAIQFNLGIGIRATTGIADNDTGAPTANDVVANLFFR
jgi:hypothetical protein